MIVFKLDMRVLELANSCSRSCHPKEKIAIKKKTRNN